MSAGDKLINRDGLQSALAVVNNKIVAAGTSIITYIKSFYKGDNETIEIQSDGTLHVLNAGVMTFNNRTGDITPASGDYTASMVGALPTQTGKKGQVLGFIENNTVGAVTLSAQRPSYTVNLNNEWQMSDLVGTDGQIYQSFSNYHVSGNTSSATCSITFTGYNEFTIMARSYGEEGWDYLLVGNIDDSDVRDNNCKLSFKDISSSASVYTPITYSGLDGGTHTITLKYIKDDDNEAGADRAYFYIPTQADDSKTITISNTFGLDYNSQTKELSIVPGGANQTVTLN